VAHCLAAVAGLADAVLPGRAEGELAGEREVLAVGGEELGEVRLGLAALVGVGGVDEGSAGLGEGGEDAR
jgi:hypothetical protein